MDQQALLRRFGLNGFRPGQEGIINAILAGRDVLGVMPTGGGKSLCYQIPALALPGVTVVVSPLISLMHDQMLSLKSLGIPAAYINSTLNPRQIELVCRRAVQGEYKILYLAPERLESPGIVALLRQLTLSLLAVDEAHCVSQWGPDFRPSYLGIPRFLAKLSHRPPVAAFTATATHAVREDIIALLGLDAPFLQVTGFDRPNLYFDVVRLYAPQKGGALEQLLRQRKDKSGIVYCATRAGVEQVYGELVRSGFSVGKYHGGLNEEERRHAQEDFRFDRIRVMVATNAFGMGIDKSNIRFVIHYNMPLSPEAYYQEAGRGGRDGAGCDCILLFSQGDVTTAKYLIENGGDREEVAPEIHEQRLAKDLRRVFAMEYYCKTEQCLRRELLGYFGEVLEEDCGNCGCCLRRHQRRNITREGQILLSTAVRAQKALGRSVGVEMLADIVYGGNVPPPLDQLTTYGLLSECSMAQIMQWLDCLTREDFLVPQGEGVMPGVKGREVLFQGKKVWMEVYSPSTPLTHRHREEELTGDKLALYRRLEQARKKLARRYGVPDYTLCTDATLVELVLHRPQSMEELAAIDGIGEFRAGRYAPSFLPLLRED